MVKMYYKGVAYSYKIINGTVKVFRIEKSPEELPTWLYDSSHDEINECIIDNIDPNSIPWDTLFEGNVNKDELC